MGSDWPRARFADLIADGILEIGDGYRAKNEELGGDGPIFLRAGLVQDSGIDLADAERFLVGRIPVLSGKLSRPGDVLVTTKGNSTGRVAYVDARLPQVVYSPHLSYWRSLRPDVLWPGYVRYWSRGADFRNQLAGMAASTDMAPYLSLTDQRRLTLPIPPIDEQRRIGGILGALDDKIELNHRMAETLEGLARAAYAELQADSRDHWPVGSIADVAFNPRDRVDPTQVDPATPYIALEHVPRGRMVLGEWGQAAAAESSKMAFHQNDILFGKLRPYFRKVGVVSASGICSTDIIVIRPKGVEDLGYVLAVTTDPLFIDASNAASTGTRMPRTSWSDLVRYPLPIPPAPARAAFTKRLWPLIERAQAAMLETRTIEQIRDTLLPRLVSGDIEVAA